VQKKEKVKQLKVKKEKAGIHFFHFL